MNKGTLTLMGTVGSIAGGSVPILFGDNSFLDGWSLLGGLVGGLVGIWVGVKLSKRFG